MGIKHNIKQKNILIMGSLLNILILSTVQAAEPTFDPYESESGSKKVNGQRLIPKEEVWENRIKEAARTWGQSPEELKREAERFLAQYHQKNPDQSYPSSIMDLIVLEKPNRDELEMKIREFNQRKTPHQPVANIKAQMSGHEFKFLIPAS